MSNETDLDWLARNVHVWPAGDHQPWCYVYWKGGQRAVSGNCITVIQPCVRVEMSDWLARRAELQNKPSWETHEYKVISQGKNGSWYGSNYSEEKFGHESSFCITGTGWNFICRGVDLGDWRDTLEKRPEEFKQFTSIEDSQEKEMKRDNGWFERGELPPVGTVCEYTLGANAPWYQCEIKYVIRGNGVVMKRIPCGGEQYCGLLHRNPVSFRPVRTERDVLLSIIVEEMNRYDTDGKLADAILAAGFSLRDK